MKKWLYIAAGVLLISYGTFYIIKSSKHFDEITNSNSEVTNETPPPPPPPQIEYNLSRHKKKLFEFLKDCNLNGDKKNLVNACDYYDGSVRNKAVQLAGSDEGKLNLGQICDIFDYCYKNWKYVNDPRVGEIYSKASSTLANGLNGDCDDFAIIMCAMVLAVGGEARINFAYGADGGHAFTEMNLGSEDLTLFQEYVKQRYNLSSEDSEFWVRKDKDGNSWMNLDWWANRPAGKYFEYINGTSFYIIQKYCENFTQ